MSASRRCRAACSRPGGCAAGRDARAHHGPERLGGVRPARRSSGRPRRPVQRVVSAMRSRTGRAGRPGLGRAGGGQLVSVWRHSAGWPRPARRARPRAPARPAGRGARFGMAQRGHAARGSASVAASSTSGPDSSTASARASATLRAMGPSTSSVSDSGRLPARADQAGRRLVADRPFAPPARARSRRCRRPARSAPAPRPRPRRAAGRAARRAGLNGVPGVACGALRAVLAGQPEREFGHARLAQDHHAVRPGRAAPGRCLR